MKPAKFIALNKTPRESMQKLIQNPTPTYGRLTSIHTEDYMTRHFI